MACPRRNALPRLPGCYLDQIGDIPSAFFDCLRWFYHAETYRLLDENFIAFVCCLCVCCLLFLDVLQTTRNEKVSDVQKLYAILHERNIKPDEVLIYKTTGRIGSLLGFYYTRLLQPEINNSLQAQAGIKAVVTDTENAHEVTRVFGTAAQTADLKNHKGSEGGADHVVLFYAIPPHAQ